MPTADGVEIVIRNEDDAWHVLSEALHGEFEDLKDLDFRLEGWPRLKLRVDFPGPIITPSLMRGMIELQSSVYRSYAIIRYDVASINLLTKQEKDALEFEVEVKEGSSLSDIIGDKAFQELINALINKMEPADIIITVLGVALILVGGSVIKSYLQERTEQRKDELGSNERREQLEHLKFISEQETERMKVLAAAMQEKPALLKVDDEAENVRQEILKQSPEHQEVEIAGAVLDGRTARELVKNPRRQTEEVEIDEVFSILRVDTTAPDGFRVRLESLDGNLKFTASVQDVMISENQRRIIQAAEWAKKPIRTTIRAKVRGDQIVEAVITDAEEIDKVSVE